MVLRHLPPFLKPKSCGSDIYRRKSTFSGSDDLLRAIFKSWSGKKIPYLTGVMDEFFKSEGTPCINGDATIWSTKLTHPPTNELIKLKTCSSGGKISSEANIIDLLVSNCTSLTWFHNTSKGWAGVPGNNGKTDISAVLVGNVLGAPIRRDSFLIGFMLVRKIQFTFLKSNCFLISNHYKP